MTTAVRPMPSAVASWSAVPYAAIASCLEMSMAADCQHSDVQCQASDAEPWQRLRMNEKVSPEVLAAHAKMARERVFDTQEAAAKVIGCGRTTVLNWESEKDPKPIKNSQYQEAAASAYKVRLKWLIDGEGPDGYPLRETETNPDAAPTRPKTTDNDTLKGSLHELQ